MTETTFKPFLPGASTSRKVGATAGALALCLALAAANAPAARPGTDAELCVAGTGNRDLDVAVCGRALRAGELAPATRATLHVARGRAHAASGHTSRAIADFDAAIELLPVSAEAHDRRGLARMAQGRYGAAIADFDRAIALFPRHAAAFRHRGMARFLDGDLRRAAADLDAALDLVATDPEGHAFRAFVRYECTRHAASLRDLRAVAALGYPYDHLSLWIDLAARGAEREGRRALEEALETIGEDAWPGPLIAAFLGIASPADALSAAAGAHSAVRARRIAETHFYIGERARLEGDAMAAERHFRRAVAAGARGTVEDAMARRSLARMQAEGGGPACG